MGVGHSGEQSTIACALEQHLLHLHKFTYRLDGDNVRFGLNKDLGFDEKSRNENIRRIGEVCPFLLNIHLRDLASNVSPFPTLYRTSRAAGLEALHRRVRDHSDRIHLAVPRRPRRRA